MMLRIVYIAAVLLTALYLVPEGAHLFALPNKIGLERDAYFAIQQIYRGWALFGAVLIPALLVDVVLAILLHRERLPAWPALLAGILMAATLAIFFTWTYPANQATDNWTTMPASWETLRTQWEYSHAVNAVLTFLALWLVVLARPQRP